MLQKIRDNAHGWWTWVLVPILIILFAFWGIGNYLGGSFSQNEVARVNGQSISATSFESMYQNANNSKNSTQNPQMSQAIKGQTLQMLIDKLLLTQGLQKLGFAVNDATLNQLIYQISAFQQNGQFSMQLYQNVLQSIGQTTESLKADVSQTYLINQFQNGLVLSTLALPNEMNTETRYMNMLRNVTYITLPLNHFAPKNPPTAAEIQAFYTANQNNFLTPLQVKLAYITISANQFKNEAEYAAALNQAANLAFQNAGSLDSIVQALKTPIQTTAMIDTSHPTGVLTNAAVLQAVNTGSVLTQGNNSNVMNLSPTQAVVLRVVGSVAPSPLPLTSVEPQIISQIQTAKAKDAALTTLKSLVNAVNQGGSLTQLATAYGFPAQTATGINSSNKGSFTPEVLNAILSLGAKQGAMIPLNDNSFMVVEVNETYANPKASNNPVSSKAIQNLWTQIEAAHYLTSLQETAKVKINQALFKQS